MASTSNRLRELDVLRGASIIGVLFRHQPVHPLATNMGWISVDLFFLLSGFFVSGLFFREYLKYNTVEPVRFLVRRGFKIYPIYYLTYPLYLGLILWGGHIQVRGLVADLVFMQNYLWGWGYAYPASWTLSIEEHFYVGLAVLLGLGVKKNWITLKVDEKHPGLSQVEKFALGVMVLCLCLRVVSNLLFPQQNIRNFSMTHLRMDTLLTGVLIAYLYYFRLGFMKRLFMKYHRFLPLVCLLAISWCPFIDPLPSFFVKTIGFTIVYIGFSALLIYFLLETEINRKLDRVLTAPVVTALSKIGYCSYCIYVIHEFVIFIKKRFAITFDNKYLDFLLVLAVSIALGFLLTYTVERFFLQLRDKYFPSKAPSSVQGRVGTFQP